MKRVLWLALAAGSITMTPVAGQGNRYEITGNRVAIFNPAGEVRVERATGSAVVVEVTRGGADAAELDVNRGTYEQWSTLVVRYPSDRIVYPRLGRSSRTEMAIDDDGLFALANLRASIDEEGFHKSSGIRISSSNRFRVSGSGSGVEAWADLRVMVPAGKSVAINLGAGTVSASNVDGELRIDTRTGAIQVSSVNGSVLANTGSGAVTVAGVNGHLLIDTGSGRVAVSDAQRGTVRIDTGSGSVIVNDVSALGVDIDTGSGSVTIADVAAPALRIDTGSGSIRAERVNARDLNLDTGSGSITLDLLSDVRNAVLDTGSGSVTVGIPSALGAEIEIDVGSGGISTDLPMQLLEQRRNYLRGRLGDGDGRIRIDTGAGGVRLRAR